MAKEIKKAEEIKEVEQVEETTETTETQSQEQEIKTPAEGTKVTAEIVKCNGNKKLNLYIYKINETPFTPAMFIFNGEFFPTLKEAQKKYDKAIKKAVEEFAKALLEGNETF